jgi:3-methyladenine DNA glycosylase/8-oxoguanine DNA glycosylase
MLDPRRAVRHLKRIDPKLARWIERVGPFRLSVDGKPSAFEALAESIVYQQISGKAAQSILARLRANVGLTPRAILEAPLRKLRQSGVSQGKAAALRDLARRTLDGTVPSMRDMRRLHDEEIIERLVQVRGIGRWTAQMLLMFRLGRPDVLPVTDYGIRKGFGRVYRTRELPPPAKIETHGERWRPYRTVASWYLWRVLEIR